MHYNSTIIISVATAKNSSKEHQRYDKWAEEEIALLLHLANDSQRSWPEIAKYFHRSVNSCRKKYWRFCSVYTKQPEAYFPDLLATDDTVQNTSMIDNLDASSTLIVRTNTSNCTTSKPIQESGVLDITSGLQWVRKNPLNRWQLRRAVSTMNSTTRNITDSSFEEESSNGNDGDNNNNKVNDSSSSSSSDNLDSNSDSIESKACIDAAQVGSNEEKTQPSPFVFTRRRRLRTPQWTIKDDQRLLTVVLQSMLNRLNVSDEVINSGDINEKSIDSSTMSLSDTRDSNLNDLIKKVINLQNHCESIGVLDRVSDNYSYQPRKLKWGLIAQEMNYSISTCWKRYHYLLQLYPQDKIDHGKIDFVNEESVEIPETMSMNSLSNPVIRRSWTEKDHQALVSMVSSRKYRWREIAARLGRTIRAVQSRFAMINNKGYTRYLQALPTTISEPSDVTNTHHTLQSLP